MRNNKFLKYICLVLAVLILVPSVYAFADDGTWDKGFTGEGSPDITFRSYITLYVYENVEDYDELDPEQNAIKKIDLKKITTDSKVQGVYVLRYKNEDIITYDNCGSTCRMTFAKNYAKKLYQYLYNDSSIGGRENYFMVGQSSIKVYARKNLKGPYRDYTGKTEWKSLQDCDDADFMVNTDSVSGGIGEDKKKTLTGARKLEDAQISNIREIYMGPWGVVLTPLGMDIEIRFDANTGSFDNKDTLVIQKTRAYEGYCIEEEPTKNGYYFWGWTEKKWKVGTGPARYEDMYHGGESLDKIWKRTTLYAVWGTLPFDEAVAEDEQGNAHIHSAKRVKRPTGDTCPICGQRLYEYVITCRT